MPHRIRTLLSDARFQLILAVTWKALHLRYVLDLNDNSGLFSYIVD